MLPFLDDIKDKHDFSAVIPISAKENENIDVLEKNIDKTLPVSFPVFPEEQLSDRSEQFFAAEFIREKLTRKLGDELPYQISVTIDKFLNEEKLLSISATIWVATTGQKAIVIGKNGDMLKNIGAQARKDMEIMFNKKVFLQTWVKVKEKWMDNIQALKQFGYSHQV